MREEYQRFLAGKAPAATFHGIDPYSIDAPLFDFQRAATEFCLRRGKAALFLDTGLGKTVCELEFSKQASRHTQSPSLILTPLAVAKQIEREAAKFGYDARVVREADEIGSGINICNYDRLEKLDPSVFGCVVLDESSIIKSFMGKTTRALIETFKDTPFRLAATATPAPNDHVELGTHAEFLGVMSQSEMLVRWFINDSSDTGTWRLKGHAVGSFWDWCASWAVMAESPYDLGFDGSGFILPTMNITRHKAAYSSVKSKGLFGFDVSATEIHALKRKTAQARADEAARIRSEIQHEPLLIWCDTDYESTALQSAIPDAIEVKGSMPATKKEEIILRFLKNPHETLITKPSICGYGLNFQHCSNMIFVGQSFSYENYYQAVRRCWRFGQSRPVNVHMVVAEGEYEIGRVVERKAHDHADMKAAMRTATKRAFGVSSAVKVPYNPTHQGRLPLWLSAV